MIILMNADFKEEKKLWKMGYRYVAGVDEVGRGTLAGPVTACAVTVLQFPISNPQFLKNLKDSKQLSLKKREEFYEILAKHPQIVWATGSVSEKVIDKINIFEANKLAMKKAVEKLRIAPDFLILDGRIKIDTSIPQKSIVKADEKVFSCAAASIIAKVTRDRLMARYHKQYPQYGFDLHKGYATKLHMAMLGKYGICEIHRKSFEPVRKTIAFSGG